MVDREIPLIKAKKTKEKDVVLDPAGFFVIELSKDGIRTEYFSNVYKNKRIVSGRLEKVFTGTKVSDLVCIFRFSIPSSPILFNSRMNRSVYG